MLEHLIPVLPALIGGSADLTGSNGTRTKDHTAVVGRGSFAGNYIHYGVREHGMAAAMNGMALHGGLIPYGGTFLVFTDYCRPSIRLSALMRQRVDLRHDARLDRPRRGRPDAPAGRASGGLRAIPNLNVFRPADAVETAECWELALLADGTPSILALTRQAVPDLRTKPDGREPVRQGRLCAGRDRRAASATSPSWPPARRSALAMEARELLAKDGIDAAVVSMPCWELFAAQPDSYRKAVLGSAPRVAVEAAIGMGWERWLGDGGTLRRHERLRRLGAGRASSTSTSASRPRHIVAAARKLVG